MKAVLKLLTIFFLLSGALACSGQNSKPEFKILVLAENGGHHILFSQRAAIWLDKLAQERNFSVEYLQNTEKVNEKYLSQFQLFIQLDYPPYGWTKEAETAFVKYISEGKGGWIGLHHATLLGEFDGFKMWDWFSDFMGGIRYKNYIPTFVSGKVNVEKSSHPVMKDVPSSFQINQEEWYIYDKSPRKNVQVLASVDESSFQPETGIKMGDHPVVWTNPAFKARNIYIFMGHSPKLFENEAYVQLFKNAIFWAANQKQ